MRRMTGILLFATLVVAAQVVATGPAWATTVCDGTHVGATFAGPLTVPDHHLCRLFDSVVEGTITVGNRAAVVVGSGSTIEGSIQAEGGTVQIFGGSRVEGSVTSVRPQNHPSDVGGSLRRVFICGSTVGGSVVVQRAVGIGSIQLGGPDCIGSNTVNGNVVLQNNTVAAGNAPNHLVGNTIGGNLVCFGNSPVPTVSGNAVTGHRLGQCAPVS